MIGCVTQEAIDRQNAAAAKAYRPYLSVGHGAESPSNEPGRSRESGPGEIAAGHRLGDGPHGVPGLDAQPQRVRPPWQAGVMGDGPMAAGIRDQRAGVQAIGAEAVTTVTQTGAGAPIGSSYHEHGAAVDRVEHMPAAVAASPALAGQLGPRAPSGIPLQPPIHTAPTGPGAQFRVNTPQAAARGGATYLPGTIGGAF